MRDAAKLKLAHCKVTSANGAKKNDIRELNESSMYRSVAQFLLLVSSNVGYIYFCLVIKIFKCLYNFIKLFDIYFVQLDKQMYE